jgi:hypothetical protein
MPTYFHFHYHDATNPNKSRVFSHKLDSQRCTFIKANGQQCKRQCVIGLPCCRSHLDLRYHVAVKPSTIPHSGLGLFAHDLYKGDNDIVFKAKEKICPYEGEIIDKRELEKRYGEKTAPYGIQIYNDRYEDAATHRGIGSLVNHKSGIQANCEFMISNKFIWIRAKKNIRNGDELFVSYGRRYHLHERGVVSSTNHKKHSP